MIKYSLYYSLYVCKQAVCLHFELLYFLKYDVLSEYLTPFRFATFLNECELVRMFKKIRNMRDLGPTRALIYKRSGTHVKLRVLYRAFTKSWKVQALFVPTLTASNLAVSIGFLIIKFGFLTNRFRNFILSLQIPTAMILASQTLILDFYS